jgi:cyclopropane fatty-acyl-phospholipid synthase-like methyltransferase
MISKAGHEYSSKFFEYINHGSIASGEIICPLLISLLVPASLLDVGCGTGAWCRIWLENGVVDVHGVDGQYINPAHLLFPQESFMANDLSQPFDLGRKFDLITSLEVAEHIAASSADVFMDNLARHGDLVLFSAAVPGQGGEFHVHEQPLEYWRDKMAQRGYRCFDPLRELVRNEPRVEPWYRYNCLLYARG